MNNYHVLTHITTRKWQWATFQLAVALLKVSAIMVAVSNSDF